MPAPAVAVPSPLSRSGVPAGASPLVIPELLRPLIEIDGPSGEGAAPFSEAMLMLIRLLGDVHRDHLEMVREELEQIRHLSREMAALKAKPIPSTTAPKKEPIPGPTTPVAEPPPARPDPMDVHFLVGERLAAWETERESRWRKVIGLLVKS